jgi:hypothetical protein
VCRRRRGRGERGEGFGRYAFGGAGACRRDVGLDVGCMAMALRGYVALSPVEKEASALDAARENMSSARRARANVSSSSSSSWIAAFGVDHG